ncbi:MAG: hypothetical protein ACKO5E_18880 [bacterium]
MASYSIALFCELSIDFRLYKKAVGDRKTVASKRRTVQKLAVYGKETNVE